jgi:hypothetical protein
MCEVDALALIFVKPALGQSGCPLCRLAREREAGILDNLLLEHVNDISTRVRISQSLGFCPAHTRQLYYLETAHGRDALGNSIMYADLIGQVDRILAAPGGKRPSRAEAHMRERILGWFSLAPGLEEEKPGTNDPLQPAKACPVCESLQQSAQFYARNLLYMLADPRYRQMYDLSDGLCLAHLHLTLAQADHADGRTYLVAETRTRLEALQANLEEYARKQAWQYRDEVMTDAERSAPRRALEFLAGWDPTHG